MLTKFNAASEEELQNINGGVYTGSTFSYTIGKGDYLRVIAQKFNIPVERLCELNGIDNPDSVEIGQKINIPLIP